jgi:hypothetical protein
MRNDLTDITVVLDRSGSMEACRKEAEGGLNSFVREQKKEKGDARFTLVQFDTEYEFVHTGIANYNSRNYKCATSAVSGNISRMRGACGANGQPGAAGITPDFTDQERKDMAAPTP